MFGKNLLKTRVYKVMERYMVVTQTTRTTKIRGKLAIHKAKGIPINEK